MVRSAVIGLALQRITLIDPMLIAWLNVPDNGEAVCKNEGFKSVRLRK